MNAVEDKIPALVAEELNAANREHDGFHSLHEGYAVLLEEVQEAKEALDAIHLELAEVWDGVWHDDQARSACCAERLEIHAVRLAAEALQVAAMAHKFQDFGRDVS